MAVTLDQILTLAGRLEDGRGFDAPRERFRRFLRDYVGDAALAASLIEQCRYAPDDQHRRALEDLVLLLGRFLGFDITFSAPGGDRAEFCGMWHSPARLRAAVTIGLPLSAGMETLRRSVAEMADSGSGVPAVGLFVAGSASSALSVSDRSTAAPSGSIRIVPLAGLLSLCAMMQGGRVEHADVVRMLESGIPVDFVLGLLGRTSPADPPALTEAAVPLTPAPRSSSGYWMASVPPDHATSPEEFLEVVVARRHVFGVTDKGTVVGIVSSGDWICFYIPGKGVVGHARVEAIADGTSGIRDARRFRQVLSLESLDLHPSRPAPLDAETELRLRAAPSTATRQAQTLLEISHESFRAMTAPMPKSAVAIEVAGGEAHGDVPDGAPAALARERLSG